MHKTLKTSGAVTRLALGTLLLMVAWPVQAQDAPQPPSAAAQDAEDTAEGAAGEPSEEATPDRASDADQEDDAGDDSDGADEATPEAPSEGTTLFHLPPAIIDAGQAQPLQVIVERDWKVEKIWLNARLVGSQEPFSTFEMKRTNEDAFSATLPGKLCQPPGVEYYIASQGAQGEQLHFASAEAPQRVLVQGVSEEMLRAGRLQRHNGNRATLASTFELTSYGPRKPPEGLEADRTLDGSDQFWTTEVEFTWRLLETLYDLRFGVGVMRGTRAQVVEGGETVDLGIAGPITGPDPGLNYGWSEANLELHRNFSMGARLVLGASEEGFVAGGRGLFRIGAIGTTYLEVGAELVSDFGSMGYLMFAWDTVPRLPMSLTIEISDHPDASASPPGTRLIFETGWEITDHFTITGRIGRVNRESALEAGLVGGVGMAIHF